MMHFEEDFLLVHKEVAEESGREELPVEEEAVDGGDEYQDEGPYAKDSDVLEQSRQKKRTISKMRVIKI